MRPEYTWIGDRDNRRKRIMQAVCEEFECTPDELTSNERPDRNIYHARVVFSYILRTRLVDTLKRIAFELKVNHASVIYQLNRMEQLISMKDVIAKKCERIETELLTKKII